MIWLIVICYVADCVAAFRNYEFLALISNLINIIWRYVCRIPSDFTRCEIGHIICNYLMFVKLPLFSIPRQNHRIVFAIRKRHTPSRDDIPLARIHMSQHRGQLRINKVEGRSFGVDSTNFLRYSSMSLSLERIASIPTRQESKNRGRLE